MLKSRKGVPSCVYILADHLDGVLAAGEDLVKAGSFWPEGTAADPGVAGAQRWTITRLRAHEVSLITHIVQARSCAKELSRDAHAFRASAHLFSSALHDLEDIGDKEPAGAFDTGTDSVGFLRERGLIAPDVAGALPREALKISDAYLVAGKIPLGIVLDLVSEFLDALDIAYELYPATSESECKSTRVGHAA